METMLLDLKRVTVDQRLQLRGETDENMVDEYANLIADGAVFPPPVVYFDGETRWLSDGFTRYAAYKLAGKAGAKFEIRKGSWDDAFRHSMSSNLTNGNRPTNKHKHFAVVATLAHPIFGQWSDREIAIGCGTSHTFVADMRHPERAAAKQAKKRDGKKATPREKEKSRKGVVVSDPSEADTDKVAAPATHAQVINSKDVPRDDSLDEDPIAILTEQNLDLKNRLAAAAMGDATDEERAMAVEGLAALQRELLSVRAERDTMAVMRDSYMNENAELKSEIKRLRKRLDQALAKA